MPSLKIKDAKVMSINGGIEISWQMSDNSWLAAKFYQVSDDVKVDPTLIKAWCQKYKDSYNAGKTLEDEKAAMSDPPPSVDAIINTPLNLQ